MLRREECNCVEEFSDRCLRCGGSGYVTVDDGVASEPAPAKPVWEECVGSHDEAEPAVERPTERLAEMEKEWMSQTEYLDYTNWLNHKHLELESELSSLRRELDHHTSECRRLDADGDKWMSRAALAEKRVEELKAALRTYGRHKDTWKCMTGERACASISGGKCDCGFEKALGTPEELEHWNEYHRDRMSEAK